MYGRRNMWFLIKETREKEEKEGELTNTKMKIKK